MANNSRNIILQRQKAIVSFVKSQEKATRDEIQSYIGGSKLTIVIPLSSPHRHPALDAGSLFTVTARSV